MHVEKALIIWGVFMGNVCTRETQKDFSVTKNTSSS